LPESARGRAAHEHVARRAGEAHAESHQGHERGERPPRHPTRSDQQRAQRAETERSGNELLLALAPGGEEPARGDAAGAAEQVGSQRSGGRGERHSVGALEDRRSEVLQPTEGHHGEHEEEEAHPDDARAQEREGAALLWRVLGGQGSDLEPAAVEKEQRERGEADHRGAEARGAPAPYLREREHEHRCRRPAEAAREAVDGEGVPQPGRGDAPVDERVVRGMEDAVAQARDRGRGHQPGIACRRGERQARAREQRHAAVEHAQRAEAVDHESRQRLPDPRDHEERGHQRADLREREAELRHQVRKQRRHDEVEEVRGAVRETNQRDDGGVVAQAGRGGWICGGHRQIVSSLCARVSTPGGAAF